MSGKEDEAPFFLKWPSAFSWEPPVDPHSCLHEHLLRVQLCGWTHFRSHSVQPLLSNVSS